MPIDGHHLAGYADLINVSVRLAGGRVKAHTLLKGLINRPAFNNWFIFNGRQHLPQSGFAIKLMAIFTKVPILINYLKIRRPTMKPSPEKQKNTASRQKSLLKLKQMVKERLLLRETLSRAREAQGIPNGNSPQESQLEQALKERAGLKEKDLH